MSSSNWIAQATAGAHGQFKAKAKRAGMNSVAFAQKVKKSPKKFDKITKSQAQLLLNMTGKGKMAMDPEDMVDHGADESKEAN